MFSQEEKQNSGPNFAQSYPVRIKPDPRRLRLPPSNLITIETVHSAFKVTRDKDKQYDPPGRLRQYDLIILDEVSQIDQQVWTCLQVALGELSPCPFVAFVGDFQQLQPVKGRNTLYEDLVRVERNGGLRTVELRQHAAARSTDPAMLHFLAHARQHQPTRSTLETFFRGRRLPKDLPSAVQQAIRLERATGKTFTFLTVTNKGAKAINLERLRAEFPEAAAKIDNFQGVIGDPTAEAGILVLEVGMRVRLTRNVDKDRGFVNGNMGKIVKMLGKDVFIMESLQGTRILVHPIREGNQTFVLRLDYIFFN
jgi:hypothetical protein